MAASSDIIDLLLNGDPAQAAARQAAMLRGKQQFQSTLADANQNAGSLDLLNFVAQNSGSPVLAKSVGALQQSQAARYAPQKLDKGVFVPATGAYEESPGAADEKEADRQARALNAASVAQARTEAAQAAADARTTAAQAAADARRFAAEQSREGRILAATIAASNRGAMTAAQQAAADARKERLDDKQEQDVERNTTKFGQVLTKNGIPQIAEAVHSINDMLDKTPEGKLKGFGYGAETLSKIPMVSDWTVGEEGKVNRSKVQRLINAMTLTEAGKAVTANELVRQAIVNMAGDKYTEKDFRNAMEQVVLPAIENVRANVVKSTDPKIIDRYQSNDPTAGFDPRKSFLRANKPAVSTPPKVDPDQALIDKYRKSK